MQNLQPLPHPRVTSRRVQLIRFFSLSPIIIGFVAWYFLSISSTRAILVLLFNLGIYRPLILANSSKCSLGFSNFLYKSRKSFNMYSPSPMKKISIKSLIGMGFADTIGPPAIINGSPFVRSCLKIGTSAFFSIATRLK